MNIKQATVLKISSKNTLSVSIQVINTHTKLKEKYIKHKKLLINYESTLINTGNKILIYHDKKLSKRKSWQILKILNNDTTRQRSKHNR
ncbi:30S ribosomal protein S17 [Candidatus Vidania fulgoroideae]|uniref:30S ribosomal protein S17 n=1 Tax=Candidatus Vidania fulgoroideorum TaxID=881286 RepID=A0A975AE10_9PROT|nr:30S ribosomal protein S17 [Candidatus Vidania fulgoroideae]